MNIWQKLIAYGRSLFDLNDGGDLSIEQSCAPRPGDVGFTAAVIGLGAKLAKADGRVTDDEVMVFSRVFRAAPEDAQSVRRVFDLARQTVRGYESYARRIGKKYKDRPCLLEGVLDGLFQIALADGVVTQDEMTYLEDVSRAFGFTEETFRRIRASHLGADRDDPYHVLGVAHDAEYSDIRLAYRQLMAENHPDSMAAIRDAPSTFEDMAHKKAAAITSAFARIKAERGLIISMD